GLAGDGAQPRNDLFFVRLVLEGGNAGAALGVIAHRAGEQHHGPAVRPLGPCHSPTHRDGLGGQADPIVFGRRRDQPHTLMLGVGPAIKAREPVVKLALWSSTTGSMTTRRHFGPRPHQTIASGVTRRRCGPGATWASERG